MQLYPSKRKWLSFEFSSTISALRSELKQYSVEKEPLFTDGVFEYTGYFGKMSLVLKKITNSLNVQNLKRVQIYTTHSFYFDCNYEIPVEKYAKHSPDLVIISPKIYSSNGVSVSLTTKKNPGYPDNLSKAPGGLYRHGKPGLAGYNGGIFATLDNLNQGFITSFDSRASRGGPGQDGNYDKKDFFLSFFKFLSSFISSSWL